jgi:hypothetical protein
MWYNFFKFWIKTLNYVIITNINSQHEDLHNWYAEPLRAHAQVPVVISIDCYDIGFIEKLKRRRDTDEGLTLAQKPITHSLVHASQSIEIDGVEILVGWNRRGPKSYRLFGLFLQLGPKNQAQILVTL